ncbi:tyrosine-type recombinase/integrase [Flavobacterium sp. 3HN19-14]|uniref:tyrosine-type recombinase/integrase n=1 Tax=Flavobacterium sp. 3HN19-14 TaxID=3448133 RepID=UPI003EE09E1C
MASVQFRIRSKANKNVAVKIRVSLGRNNDLELNTGFTINPNSWSDKTHLPKQNATENKQLYNNLKKLETFVFDNLNKDLSKGILVDSFWLETQISDCFGRIEKNDVGLLSNHIQYIIDNANTRKIKGRKSLGLSESRVKSYVTFKNVIAEYEAVIKKKIHFLDVNKSFVDRFTNWLINTKNFATNYAGKHIDNLKTVCVDAKRNEIPTNPFVEHIQSFSESEEDKFIVTLSFDELEKIKEAEIKSDAYNNARKWILIGCEIGQRGGDLLDITKENIRYKSGNIYLDLIQQKTKKSVTIGIIAPHVIDIIENDFPYKISTQKLNEYIKKVCEIAKIDEVIEGKKLNAKTNRKELKFYPKHELITTHSFRRSFATNYYKKIPTPILINITGHSKESLFLAYINKREDKDSNADLFMKFYEDIHKKDPQLTVLKKA